MFWLLSRPNFYFELSPEKPETLNTPDINGKSTMANSAFPAYPISRRLGSKSLGAFAEFYYRSGYRIL